MRLNFFEANFSPLFGEMIPIFDLRIFFKWVAFEVNEWEEMEPMEPRPNESQLFLKLSNFG